LDEAKNEVERPRYREFTVTPGLCGFKVKIGCSELYFEDVVQLGQHIANYLENPQKTERKFQEGDIRDNRGGGLNDWVLALGGPCRETRNRDA
jgi:hypothetical protein